MADNPSPLSVAIKGAIAGLVGTAAMSMAMEKGPQLLEENFGISMSPEADESAGSSGAPTEELAQRVAEGVFDRSIDAETKGTAGEAIHWGYGAGWGAVFGIAHSSLRIPTLLHGAIFGGLVGVVGSTLVPAMGLAPSPSEQPKRNSAMQFGFHLIFGWVTAITFWLLTIRD